MALGKIRCSRRGVVLTREEEHVSTRDGERGLYQYLSSVRGLGGFQDHFEWWLLWLQASVPALLLFLLLPSCLLRWASNTFSIRGGKPFWVDPFDQKVQHIFIDDNIRQDDEDTIVHPKVGCFLLDELTKAATGGFSQIFDLQPLILTLCFRCFSIQRDQRPGQHAPLSSTTSPWSRRTCSRPSQTWATSPAGSASAWRTTRGTCNSWRPRNQRTTALCWSEG